MDWDDLEPKKNVGITIGDDLSNLSLKELHDRIEALSDEIERMKGEIDKKKSTQNAANDVFKS